MKIDVSRVDVWAASIEDRPGGLSEKLDALAQAGASLEFVIARRCPDKPGTAVVFVTPIKGPAQIKAARNLGFDKTASLHSTRIACQDKPGLAAKMTARLAHADINLPGLSAAAIARRCILHLALDSSIQANKAIRALRQLA